MKNLLSSLPKKTAIIQYLDGTRETIEGCQGHWDSEDVICLCLDVDEWKAVDKVLFLHTNLDTSL
jgi:hypothetical protein